MDAKVIDSKPLQYVLVTPDAFVADGSFPLVVMMHGFGANMYDLANLSPNIDPEGYVFAFPNAPYPLEGNRRPGIQLDARAARGRRACGSGRERRRDARGVPG